MGVCSSNNSKKHKHIKPNIYNINIIDPRNRRILSRNNTLTINPNEYTDNVVCDNIEDIHETTFNIYLPTEYRRSLSTYCYGNSLFESSMTYLASNSMSANNYELSLLPSLPPSLSSSPSSSLSAPSSPLSSFTLSASTKPIETINEIQIDY
jgi:hypothetical protein